MAHGVCRSTHWATRTRYQKYRIQTQIRLIGYVARVPLTVPTSWMLSLCCVAKLGNAVDKMGYTWITSAIFTPRTLRS